MSVAGVLPAPSGGGAGAAEAEAPGRRLTIPVTSARRLHVGGVRFYEIDGALYPSVTSVLQVVAKPNLAAWARRTTIEAIRAALDGDGPYGREFLEGVLVMAAQEPERVRDTAADRGANAHEAVALALTGQPYPEALAPQVEAAIAFLEDYGLKALATEVVVVSHAHGYAGTCDLVAESTDGLVVVDWKTGGLWPEHALQLGAYAIAIEEMTGLPVGVAYLVGLREGRHAAKRVDLPPGREGFLAALTLWRTLQTQLLA